MKTLTAPAPAKINLSLRVVGRRDDGYHLLDSLVAFTTLGDQVTVSPADDLSLIIEGEFAGALDSGPDNLVIRAARALHPTLGASITLDKRLPVASGIGGGSADAAATLKLLNELWGLGHSPVALAAIGLTLGADVPVCLAGRPCRMRGIGDLLSLAPGLPPAALVLVNPRRDCPTPAVFRARQGAFSNQMTGLPEVIPDAAALAGWVRRGGNDLTRAAGQLVPEIGVILRSLGQQPDCLAAALSGSGATCFGLFADSDAANRAAARIKGDHPGWWVAATRLFA